MPPKPQMIAKQDWKYVSGGARLVRNAHQPSSEITSMAFAGNGQTLVSRGADETLKVQSGLSDVACFGYCLCTFVSFLEASVKST